MISIRYGAPIVAPLQGTSPESSNPGLKPWAETWPLSGERFARLPYVDAYGTAGHCMSPRFFLLLLRTRSCALGAELFPISLTRCSPSSDVRCRIAQERRPYQLRVRRHVAPMPRRRAGAHPCASSSSPDMTSRALVS
jgi:hypothetical protein